MLTALTRGHLSFQDVMNIHKMIGKLPRPKSGFVLPYHKYTGPYNPLNEQLDEFNQPYAGQEPYNAVDAISMRHIYVIETMVIPKSESTHVMMKC